MCTCFNTPPYVEKVRYTNTFLTAFESTFINALMIGDSLTLHFYEDMVQRKVPNSLSLCSSRTIAELTHILSLPQFQHSLPQQLPTAFLFLGTVDLFQASGCFSQEWQFIASKVQKDTDTWLAYIQPLYLQLLHQILSHQGINRVYIFTLPITPLYVRQDRYKTHYRRFNKFLLSIPTMPQFADYVSVIDIAPVFWKNTGSKVYRNMFCEKDLLHYSAIGMQSLFNHIMQFFQTQ